MLIFIPIVLCLFHYHTIAAMALMEVYHKRKAYNCKTLGRYANKTLKCVWFERWNKQRFLASGLPTHADDKFLCKVALATSHDEMIGIHEYLTKAKKGGTNHFLYPKRKIGRVISHVWCLKTANTMV